MPENQKPVVLQRRYNVERLRAESVGGAKKIVGHAAVFNRTVDICGYFFETMMPGAFARTIVEEDIRALINHNEDLVIGRNVAGNLQLSEDEIGLLMVCDPPDTSYGRDLMWNLEAGNITQQSIGFWVREEKVRTEGGAVYSDVTDAILRDVSPVTFPAYPTTDVGLRSSFEERAALLRVAAGFRSGPDTSVTDIEEWKHDLEHRRRRLALSAIC